MTKNKMKIGILSAGGDCPGINAAIRGVGKTAIVQYGMEVVGIINGFSGLLEKDTIELNEQLLSGILTLGGTILGTSRLKPYKEVEGEDPTAKPDQIKKNYHKLGLDALVLAAMEPRKQQICFQRKALKLLGYQKPSTTMFGVLMLPSDLILLFILPPGQLTVYIQQPTRIKE